MRNLTDTSDLECCHHYTNIWYYLSRYFAAYEVTKKALTPAGADPSQLNLGPIIFAGGMAGVAMWSIAIPPDVRLLHTF